LLIGSSPLPFACLGFHYAVWRNPLPGTYVPRAGPNGGKAERAKSPASLALFGALTGVSALAAVFLGVLLAG
jgi:hypothetical protein